MSPHRPTLARRFAALALAVAAVGPARAVEPPLVFVSRQINPYGSVYWDVPRDMPGVGPYSRVRPAAPGKLLVREPDGAIRTLIDGAAPSPASLNLIDVNGPAVSYDGTQIAFAGLPAGDHADYPTASVGAWRIYLIDADGGNLRQVTYSDQGDLDLSQFGVTGGSFGAYDDFDPVFLPDGRVCFASTRYYTYAQYSGVRASNLHVVNADGTRLHRITSERNGAERPLIDPITGRIVFSRWWRNHRFPIDSMTTVEIPVGGAVYGYTGRAYDQHLGLTRNRDNPVGGPTMFRNAWHAASINPDGSDLQMFSGRFRSDDRNQSYGGSFTPGGALYAGYFPMTNLTEAAGFGGVRRYARGADAYTPIIGITYPTLEYVSPANPTSFGIYVGSYASEPEVLPDGRVAIAWAADVAQDYGLYTIDADGGNLQPLYDLPGTSELRARVLAPRPLPPVRADPYRDDPDFPLPARLPPTEAGPYDIDGTFTFAALNVYGNGPVDMDIVSAPAVGSAGSIRFFIDHQRQSPGSFEHIDWPILLGERPVAPDGVAIEPAAPANAPLFEQLRGPLNDYVVPLTGGPRPDGAAHVTGMNYAPRGAIANCIGCHAGHTMIPVPSDPAAAVWSNLAPGAAVSVSSAGDPNQIGGLVDRRVQRGEIWRYWTSTPGQQSGQWAQLTFRVPVSVRSVRLYNPRFGDEANSTLQVHAATVRLYRDAAATRLAAQQTTGPLAASGTDAAFADVRARAVRIDLNHVTGTFYGAPRAGLAEVEVIARGEPRTADLNCDGAVDFFDVDGFLLALLSPAEYDATYPHCRASAGDVNTDGRVDFFDIDPFVGCLFGGDCE